MKDLEKLYQKKLEELNKIKEQINENKIGKIKKKLIGHYWRYNDIGNFDDDSDKTYIFVSEVLFLYSIDHLLVRGPGFFSCDSDYPDCSAFSYNGWYDIDISLVGNRQEDILKRFKESNKEEFTKNLKKYCEIAEKQCLENVEYYEGKSL